VLSVVAESLLNRKAREAVRIPPAFQSIDNYVSVAPGGIEKAFRTANPGLAADAIAVGCDRHRLREVRICMDKSLNFRGCKEIDRRSCRLDTVVLPPVR